jgi:hypothetical protein
LYIGRYRDEIVDGIMRDGILGELVVYFDGIDDG